MNIASNERDTYIRNKFLELKVLIIVKVDGRTDENLLERKYMFRLFCFNSHKIVRLLIER